RNGQVCSPHPGRGIRRARGPGPAGRTGGASADPPGSPLGGGSAGAAHRAHRAPGAPRHAVRPSRHTARGHAGDLPRGHRAQRAPRPGRERTLDSLLAGRAGAAVVLKDRAGREYESPARVIAPPVPGLDVVLTLDAELQEIAQRALDDALRRMDADGGDVVMLDPGTGEVL